MRADLLTLNSPGVRAAKARWDRAHQRRKHRLSFNYLLSCFKEDRVRFSEIAMASGLSIQRVHQIYERFFRPLFAERTGRERYQSYKWLKIYQRLQNRQEQVFADDRLHLPIEHARAASCKIEGVATSDREHIATVKMRSLLVNGHLCSVLQARRTRKASGSSRLYAQFAVARSVLQKVDAVIFHCAPPEMQRRIFVVPKDVILALFGTTAGPTLSVYFPLRKLRVHRSQRPRIDLSQYEDAWHLLKPTKRARSKR